MPTQFITLQSIHFKVRTPPMADSYQDSDSFNTTHGRQVGGKFYTYKQLKEGSWGVTLKDGIWYIFLIGLVLFALLSLYEVDYKKGTQKDVINRIGKLSNYTMVDIVNGSVEAAQELKEIVKTTFLANTGRTEELREWVNNKTGTFYSEIKSTIDTTINGQKSLLDSISLLPVYIKNFFAGLYGKYICGGNETTETTQHSEVEETVEKVVRKVETRTVTNDEYSSPRVVRVETIETTHTTSTPIEEVIVQ